jgi:hypothetical protein
LFIAFIGLSVLNGNHPAVWSRFAKIEVPPVLGT